MKILNLYFKNINSLEGENRIHFDKAPIVDGGVFAITGPNGSGKSSVLDVITLGLYGETFRFDRPAEHVMTKLTTESFAEVEFLLGDDKFKASWRVSRLNDEVDGELLAPEMQLTQLNGSEQVLEQSCQKVREKMAELTGMDFHKFSKSMVLSQGDFAAFLNALESERMDILEKISGSDIYDEYRQQAEQKYTQSKNRLLQLEQDLVATPVMDKETKEARTDDLDDFKEQQIELETEKNEVEQQLAWVQGVAHLEKQQDTLDKQQLQLVEAQSEHQQSLDKIEAYQPILMFKSELATLDKQLESTQQSKKRLDAYQSEVEVLQKQLKATHFDENTADTIQTISQQKQNIEQLGLKLSDLKLSLPKETALLQSLEQQKDQKKSDLTQAEVWLQGHVTDKTLLEQFPETAQLRVARTELTELTEKQSSSSKWTKNITGTIEKKKTDIKSLTTKVTQLTQQVADNEDAVKALSEGHSLQDLLDMQVEQQERVINFRELFDLASVNTKLGKKGFFAQIFNTKNEGAEVKQLKQQHDQLQLEIGREKNLIATLEAAVSNEILLKKMADDRQHLVDGKACPLCGALKHPYAEHAPAASNSKKVLKEQQKKIKTLLTDEVVLSKQITLVQQQAEKDEQKDDKLNNIRAQWNALANKLNIFTEELTIDSLSLMKELLNKEKNELNNIVNLLKQTSKLTKSIEQANESITTNSASLERNKKEVEALTVEWDNRPKDSIELEQAYKQAVEQEKLLADKVEQQLELLGEKMPRKAKEQAFFKVLNERKQAYQQQSQKLTALTEELKPLDVKIAASVDIIASLEKNIQQHSDKMQQQEGAGLHLALIEKQKMVEDKEASFSKQTLELGVLEQSLLEKLKQTDAKDLTGLREALDFIDRKEQILENQQVSNAKGVALKNKLQQLKQQLQEQQALDISQQSEYDLTGKQSSVKRKLDIAKQEVISLQNKLNKQDGLQQKQGDILAKIATQKIELEACEAEDKLASAENAIHFRRKVQQVISDRLMTQANQVLEKISGRYYVRKVASEHGLAIEVEDTKQHNVRRLPKTLSGGESFIVSLALALGLAEMSNNGQALDSLFLDEGFGNLDAESLYLAMTTLESLKTHGKVIGVISHVEGVQKRIKTQIEMSKKPNGLSALKMVS